MPTYRRRWPEVEAYFWKGEENEEPPEWVNDAYHDGLLRFFDEKLNRMYVNEGPAVVFCLHPHFGPLSAPRGVWLLKDGGGVWLLDVTTFKTFYEEVR